MINIFPCKKLVEECYSMHIVGLIVQIVIHILVFVMLVTKIIIQWIQITWKQHLFVLQFLALQLIVTHMDVVV